MPYVEWTADMGEISGFGGSYEAACRAMVKAGVEFWELQPPTFEPKFHGFKQIVGICVEDNDDAKSLSNAVFAAAPECTGMMHQAAIAHVFAFRRLGAAEYCRQLKKAGGNNHVA